MSWPASRSAPDRATFAADSAPPPGKSSTPPGPGKGGAGGRGQPGQKSRGRGVESSGGGSPGPFPVNAVHFDGTNDWLNHASQLTGAVDGENIIHSLWFKIDYSGNNGETIILNRESGGQISIQKGPTDKLRFILQSMFEILYQADSDGLFNSTTNIGWHHLLLAAQVDATPVVQVYLDDAPMDVTISEGPIEGDIDFTVPNWAIGATETGTVKATGDLAEVYMAAEYLDISVESNRRKFIDGLGFPVDLGSDGSIPTSTTPLLFFSGDTDAWHTNKGSGGGFNENGALTTASSSPSD